MTLLFSSSFQNTRRFNPQSTTLINCTSVHSQHHYPSIYIMSTSKSNVIDLVAAGSSGSQPSKPNFFSVQWHTVKFHDPIVAELAAVYFKTPVHELTKCNETRFKAMLRLFTLNQLQLAFSYVGGRCEDTPMSKGVARKAIIDLVKSRSHLTNTTASKSTPSPTAASVNTVVTLSPTSKRAATNTVRSGADKV